MCASVCGLCMWFVCLCVCVRVRVCVCMSVFLHPFDKKSAVTHTCGFRTTTARQVTDSAKTKITENNSGKAREPRCHDLLQQRKRKFKWRVRANTHTATSLILARYMQKDAEQPPWIKMLKLKSGLSKWGTRTSPHPMGGSRLSFHAIFEENWPKY